MSKIAIIGGGFSGMLAAIELLRDPHLVAEIVLIEKAPRQYGGGVAYGAAADAFHETNIAAKNMGMEKGGYALCAFAGTDPDRVMARHEIGDYLRRELAYAVSDSSSSYKDIRGEAVDLDDQGNRVVVRLASGAEIEADRVIIATGNHEIRELPCITAEQKDDFAFASRYIGDQWSPDSRRKINDIPSQEPILIVGTALSGYDAARSLLRRGHEGDIVMMSRHGLEHFQYPEKHQWPDLALPRPRFMNYPHIFVPTALTREMLAEFRELTGMKVDLDKGTVKRESFLQRKFYGHKDYLPEQVLKQWEKYIPELIRFYGAREYGRALRHHGALINVLRVGAGHGICEEIKDAKRRGQLQVAAANIHGFEAAPGGGISVRYTPVSERAPRRREFHTVISSLGTNNDYASTKTPLWRNILDRGYTAPHSVGVGVHVADNSGRLPGSENIYAVGTSVAGHRMVTDGVLGPPAFSIPGMREGIKAAAWAVASNFDFRPGKAAPPRPDTGRDESRPSP